MGFNDWMFALHLLAAFSLIAGLVIFWVLIVAGRKIDTPGDTLRLGPVAKVGQMTVGVGMVGTIVLGVYLAFARDSYAIWDFWILAAIVLWIIASAVGRQTGTEYLNAPKKALELQEAGQTGPNEELLALNRTSRGVLLHTVTSILALLIIIDMIWKPGA